MGSVVSNRAIEITKEKQAMSENLSMNQFVTFCAAATPAGKYGAARRLAQQMGEPYQPSHDYWRGARKAILDVGLGGGDPHDLKGTGSGYHPKKTNAYNKAFKGFADFCDQHNPGFCRPPASRLWVAGDVHVRVSPEFTAEIDGKTYVVKMMLKDGSSPSLKRRIEAMNTLLVATFPQYERHAVLDVRNGVLHEAKADVSVDEFVLIGDAAFLAAALDGFGLAA